MDTHLEYYKKYIDEKGFLKMKSFELSDENGNVKEQSFTLSVTREYEIYFTSENWDQKNTSVHVLGKNRKEVKFEHTQETEYLHKIVLHPSSDGIHYLTFDTPKGEGICGFGVIGFRLH